MSDIHQIVALMMATAVACVAVGVFVFWRVQATRNPHAARPRALLALAVALAALYLVPWLTLAQAVVKR